MDSFDTVVGGVLVAVAVFQLVLSVRVARSDLYDREQKLLQIQLIWLVPILGAGVVLHALRDGAPRDA